jgi:hypothetical protein
MLRRLRPKQIAALNESFFRVRFDRLTPKEKHYLRSMAELGAGPSAAIAALLLISRQQPKGLTHTQRQHRRRRDHRAPPGQNFCQYLYSFRSRSLIVTSPIPLVSLLMGRTMTFLKSAYSATVHKMRYQA